jgi:hypothetical protein
MNFYKLQQNTTLPTVTKLRTNFMIKKIIHSNFNKTTMQTLIYPEKAYTELTIQNEKKNI